MKRALIPLLLSLLAATANAAEALPEAFISLTPSDIAAQQTAVDALLSRAHDPQLLLQAAHEYSVRCIDAPVNSLEYWGPNASIEDQVRQSSANLLRLINAAQTRAQQQAGALAGNIHGANNSADITRWERLNALVHTAAEARVQALYAKVLAAELEEKASACAQAVSAANSAGVSDPITLGKIFLAAGDAAKAKTEFQKLATDSLDSPVQYQAHYFLTLCDLESGNFSSARHEMGDVKIWQDRLAAKMPTTRAGTEAAAAIFEYRLDFAEAEKTENPAEKAKLELAGIRALKTLIEKQPALKPAVLAHLWTHYAGKSDATFKEPLVLESVMQRASAADADTNTLLNAQRAAAEILRRAHEFPEGTLDYAAAVYAAVFDKTGQNRAAANAYIALAQRLAGHNQKTANAALDRAIGLFKTISPVPQEYAQALALAVHPPFSRREFLYPYANILMERGTPDAALLELRQIHDGDPDFTEAELSEMICMQRLPDDSSALGMDRLSEIESLRKDILRRVTAPSPLGARAILISAEVSLASQRPAEALAQLQTFDAYAKGSTDECYLTARANSVRFTALVQLNRPVDAMALLTQNQIDNVSIGAVAKQLDSAFQSASSDAARLSIARARVHLGEWLVAHLSGSQPTQAQLYYAQALREAGELEPEENSKRALLQKSLQVFQQSMPMDSSQNTDLTPLLGQAAVDFDLHNYAATREILLPLLNAGRVGDGQDNNADAYWQATYELLASNVALADAGNDPQARAQTAAYLKRLFIQWGQQIGGRRWHGDFERLRQKVAPQFNPQTGAMP